MLGFVQAKIDKGEKTISLFEMKDLILKEIKNEFHA